MKVGNLRQKALPWVSASVLVGGLVTACILFVVVRVESRIELSNTSTLAEEYGLHY